MSTVSYHRPASVAEAVKLLAGDHDARLLAGGQSMLPSVRLGLLAPSAFIDLAGIPDLQGIRADGKQFPSAPWQRMPPSRSRAKCRRRLPALAAGGVGHRRSAGAQSRHDRRLARQQRPGRRLPCRRAWTRRNHSHEQPYDRRGRILQGIVRDRARAGRNHHRRQPPDTGPGGVREIPAARLAICAGRCVRRAVRQDGASGCHRRGRLRVSRKGARRRARRRTSRRNPAMESMFRRPGSTATFTAARNTART